MTRAQPPASPAAFTALEALAVTAGAWAGMLGLGVVVALVGGGVTFAVAAGQLALAATAVIAARLAGRDRRALGLAPARARMMLAAALVGASAWYVNLRIVELLPLRTEDGGALGRFVQLPPLWVVLIAVVAVPAVCEELVFRGVLLRGLATRLVPWVAAAASAVVFSLYHLNPLQMIPTLLLGLALAAIALRAGSAIPGMIAHALNNAIAVLIARHELPWLASRDDTGVLDRHPTAALVVAATLVVAGLALAATAPRGAA